MNQITPRDLINALRSGEFTKHEGSLVSPDDPKARCCLGVASWVADQDATATKVADEAGLSWAGELGYPCGLDVTWVPPIPEWAPWLTNEVQMALSAANDSTSSWEERVIPLLEAIEAELAAG